MDIIFLAEPDQLDYLEENANPAEAFVCMDCQEFHAERRAQVYAVIMDLLFDEGLSLEEYVRSLSDEGPSISQLSEDLVEQLIGLEEDQIEAYTQLLSGHDLVADADIDEADISDFLFQLVNLARATCEDTDIRLYVFTG